MWVLLEASLASRPGGRWPGALRLLLLLLLWGCPPPPMCGAAFGNPKKVGNVSKVAGQSDVAGGRSSWAGWSKCLGPVYFLGLLRIAWVAYKAPPVLVRQATRGAARGATRGALRGAIRTPLCHRPIATLPLSRLCSLVGVDRFLLGASRSPFTWTE
jgi:hypothetical protein